MSWKFIGSNNIEYSPQINPVKSDPVDGYVLTFAKLRKHLSATGMESLQLGQPTRVASPGEDSVLGAREVEPLNRSANAAARISQANPTSGQHLTTPGTGFNVQLAEQWQAVQLAPQQRSHQLKNLECGASYAMKIWAFNKIGKGEPSDTITVSTRGKGEQSSSEISCIT